MKRLHCWLSLLLLVPASACMAKGSDSMMSAPPVDYAAQSGVDDGAMAGAAGDSVVSETTALPASPAPMDMDMDADEAPARQVFALGGMSRGRHARADAKGKKAELRSEPAEPAGPTTGTDPDPARAPDGTSAGSGDPEPALADEPQAHGRQIIYSAAMTLGVYDLEEALQKAEALPDKLGGYVQSMTASQLILRIPSKHLRAAMTELGGFGVIESRSLVSQDVTDEYVDLESRIKVLRETQAQLLELLHKAKTVEEALRVRQTLDQITMQLEQALGRMRQLQNAVTFSTLTLDLIERGPHQPTPSSNDPFPWVDALGVEATEWRN